MRSSVSSLLVLAMVSAVIAGCYRASDMNDLDTDDVGAVQQKYRDLSRATAATMRRLRWAIEHDPRPRVRANAASALDVLPLMDLFGRGAFSQNRRDIRRYLIRALDDPSSKVVARAANALVLNDLDDERARASLREHLPRLRAAVADPDERVADDAIGALRAMNAPLPVDVLLSSPVAAVRETGIEEADMSSDRAALPAIEAIAQNDPDSTLRRLAIQPVSKLAPPRERDALLDRLLDDPDPQIVAAAADGAADAGASGVLPHLRQMLTSSDPARVQVAIRALAKLRDYTAVPAIAGHLGNDNLNVRGEASFALDVLVGPPRSYDDWQTWARQQGYLR